MTHGQFRDELQERVKQTVAQEFLEPGMLGQLANAAYSFVYPEGLLRVPWYWNKSATLAITSNVVDKPADCQKINAIMITNVVNPLGGFLTKQATPVDVAQWDSVANSLAEAPTASNPKFREDPPSIYLAPFKNSAAANFTGTIHYKRNFPQVTDDAFELTDPNANALPILPCFMEEDAMFFAVKMVKLRARGIMAAPSMVAQMSVDYEKTMAALKAGEDPLAIWNQALAGASS